MSEIKVEIQIETNDGTEKKITSFSLSNATELERIVILQGLFETMGNNKNVSETIDTYATIKKAYDEFFSATYVEENKELNNKENDSTVLSISNEEPNESKSDSTTELTKQPKDTVVFSTNQRSVQATGIIVSSLGENHNKYQCRLHCPNCRNNNTYYIKKNERRIQCKFCKENHNVRQAKDEFLLKDGNNNFFIAGSFIGEDEKLRC